MGEFKSDGKKWEAVKMTPLDHLAPGVKFNSPDGKIYIGDNNGVPQEAGWWKTSGTSFDETLKETTEEAPHPTALGYKKSEMSPAWLTNNIGYLAVGEVHVTVFGGQYMKDAAGNAYFKKPKSHNVGESGVHIKKETNYAKGSSPTGVAYHGYGGKLLFSINHDGEVWASPDLKTDDIAAQVMKIIMNELPKQVAAAHIDPHAAEPTDAMLDRGAAHLRDLDAEGKIQRSSFRIVAGAVWEAMWYSAVKVTT